MVRLRNQEPEYRSNCRKTNDAYFDESDDDLTDLTRDEELEIMETAFGEDTDEE